MGKLGALVGFAGARRDLVLREGLNGLAQHVDRFAEIEIQIVSGIRTCRHDDDLLDARPRCFARRRKLAVRPVIALAPTLSRALPDIAGFSPVLPIRPPAL